MSIFRIVTKHGISIDLTAVGPDFSLMAVWTNIKLTGQFQNEGVCVPIDSISFLTFGDVQTSVNAPSTETKQ